MPMATFMESAGAEVTRARQRARGQARMLRTCYTDDEQVFEAACLRASLAMTIKVLRRMMGVATKATAATTVGKHHGNVDRSRDHVHFRILRRTVLSKVL
jgi:hypothetical protein